MQSRKNTFITQADAEVEAIRDTLRGAILALEVERAAIADQNQSVDADLQAILGMGVLLKDLHTQKLRVEELGGQMPSPNQVKGKLGLRVIGLTTKLFETAEHIRNIQGEAYKLARLNLRAVAAKMSAQSKLQRKTLSVA